VNKMGVTEGKYDDFRLIEECQELLNNKEGIKLKDDLKFKLEKAIGYKDRFKSAGVFAQTRKYEELLYKVGELAEFVYNNYDAFDNLDIRSIVVITDLAADVHDPLRDALLQERDADILSVLLNQQEIILRLCYGYKSVPRPKTEAELMKEQNHKIRVEIKFRECLETLRYIGMMWIFKGQSLRSNEYKAPTVNLAGSLFRYMCGYLKKVEASLPYFGEQEFTFIEGELETSQRILDAITVIVTAENDVHFERARLIAQDFASKFPKMVENEETVEQETEKQKVN